MLRARLSFDLQDYKLAKKETKTQRISVSEHVRRAPQSTLPHAGQPTWMRYAGLVGSGNPQSSLSIDEILYRGGEKQNTRGTYRPRANTTVISS